MKSSTSLVLCAVFAAGTLLIASAAADPPLVFDSANGHFWIGEPYGAPVNTEVVDFQGRRCLKCIVPQVTPGNYALVRTKRFPLETWNPTYRQAKIDVFVTGATPTSLLKLEVRGAAFDTIVDTALSQNLRPGVWTTVTWDLTDLASPVGALSIVLDNIANRAPTFYLDNLRLISDEGPRVWDTMDGAHDWFYFGNWYNWSGVTGFPGLEAVSSLPVAGAPHSEPASIYLEWRYPGSGELRAEVGTHGPTGQSTLGVDFTAVNRVSFYARSSSTATPVGIFLFDGQNGFSPSSVFLPTKDEWYLITLDLPWPESFDRTHVTELKLFVDRIKESNEGAGSVRFDQIEFSFTPVNPPANGLRVPLEDFNDCEPGLNRFGGSVGAFSAPAGTVFPTSFVAFPGEAGNFGRRFDFQAGSDFSGYYSILHGQPEALDFTFDATRLQFLRFKVRAGSPQTSVLNLKIEVKDAQAQAEKFFHTAFRTIRLNLSENQWQQVTLPFDVENPASWTHNQFKPKQAQLKELVFVVEKAFNAAGASFVLDDVEFIDPSTPAEPVTKTATDRAFLEFVLRQNLNYFLNEVHPVTGLVLDRASFSDLASVAATGFGLSVIPLAANERVIPRLEAFERARRALTTLASGAMGVLDGNPVPVTGQIGVEGFFYRYLDAATGERKVTPGFAAPDASPIDTALLVWGARTCEGAMTVANGYTPAQQETIHALVRRIVDRVNWRIFLVNDRGVERMLSGWKPESEDDYTVPFLGGFAPSRGAGVGTWDYQTDEVILIALAGLSAADPAKRLAPDFVRSWQRVSRSFAGHEVVQSFFGSAFAHQFAGLWIPLFALPPDLAGTDQWGSNLAAHRANLDFCRQTDLHPITFATFDGTSAFLTAHEDLDGRYAGGRGAPPNGAFDDPLKNTDADRITAAFQPAFDQNHKAVPDIMNGVLAPYAAGSAFYYLPQEATAILRHYYFDLQLWEPLRGFPDCFTRDVKQYLQKEVEIATDPDLAVSYARLSQLPDRAVQHVQFGIDQGPMVLSLANYLRNGLIQRWATRSGDVYRALAAAYPGQQPRGRFAGLVGGPSPTFGTSGAIELTASASGVFTGKLSWRDTVVPFRGVFSPGGYALVTIPRGKLPPLTIELRLNPSAAPGTIAGLVGDGVNSVPVELSQAPFTAKLATPDAGDYTALIAGSANLPTGGGYATVKVSTAGAVRVAGRLPDGASVSAGAILRGDGTIAVNVPLYARGARGVLGGLLVIREKAGVSDLDGDLAWLKPPQTSGLYPGGFSGTARLEAAHYFPPAAGQPVLMVSAAAINAHVTLTSTSLAAPLLYDVKLGATDTAQVTPPNAEHLALRIARTSGLLSGSFVAPGGSTPTSITGVVQLKQQRGRGLFTGAAAAGALDLAPVP
jgi:hypothetical protein